MIKLKIAVIGCGSWGRNHVRVYSDLNNVKLSAVADTNVEISRSIGEKYNVKWYTDPIDVLDVPEIDAVSICTPTVTHAEIAMRAIEKGKHVLVEKPMTNTIDEAHQIIKAAEMKGVHLSVGFVERFNPAVREAMNIVSRGDIGDVILTHTRRVSRRPMRIGDVGVIKDLAIHDIDVINHLFEGSATGVFASAGSIAHSFEDYANILICFEKERSAFVETNWLTPRKVRQLIITGTEGIVEVEYINQELRVENNDRLYQPYLHQEEPLKMELRSFAQSILEDSPPVVTGYDGIKALEICEAAINSAKTGKYVRLKNT